MFSRTITLKTQPPIQIVLHFLSRSNAEKEPAKISSDGVKGFALFVDDFGQRA